MLRLRKIAVTGGIASGKSTACQILKGFGAYVVSADEIVHQLLSNTTSPLGQNVIKLIGSDIVVNQQIDRSKIAKKVFNQPQLLKELEELLHPAVREEMARHYLLASQQPNVPLFVAEIPLLFETKGEGFFDFTVAIISNETISKQRFQNAKGYTAEDYDKRNALQLPMQEKKKRANFTIENNGSLDDFTHEIQELFTKLTRSPIFNESRQ